VNLHQRPGVLPDGPLIVAQVGLVGGAHLPQQRAAALHDIRHPEGSADLHQLAPGRGHLAACGHGREDQQHRRRVVVDHHGALRPGEPAQQLLHMGIAQPAPAVGHVILQRGVIPRHLLHGRRGPSGQARPAQIRVQHHAGAVDDAPQRRQTCLPGPGRRSGRTAPAESGSSAICAGQDAAAQLLQHLAHRLRHRLGRQPPRTRPAARKILQELVHLRDSPQQFDCPSFFTPFRCSGLGRFPSVVQI
jgi:hypothetical protein